MRRRHSLPAIWVLSDARNDGALEAVLRQARAPVGFVYRHYHLDPAARRARFTALARLARAQGHCVILSADAATARRWGADGYYAAPGQLHPRRTGLIAIATAHDMKEIADANRADADAVMLSPVFPTRSHPGAPTLGPVRFRLLARQARRPVIALGGMDQRRARGMRWPRWAAIDGAVRGLPASAR